MADGGFVLLWRRIFEHKYWLDKRPYSRFEAWLDCWACMAAFKSYQTIMGGATITLERGQFIASERFLEKRWRWSRGKVRRFMAECIAVGELLREQTVFGACSENDTSGGTIYRVVNYEVYQNGDTTDDTDQSPTKARPRTKENKGNKGKEGKASWLTPFANAWTEAFGGTAPHGRIGRALKPLVSQHGGDAVLAAWTTYLESIEAQFASVENFASKYGIWAGSVGHKDPKALVSTIKALMKIGGPGLMNAFQREQAFAVIQQTKPESWVKYEAILKAIRYSDLRDAYEKNQGREFTELLTAQIEEIRHAA